MINILITDLSDEDERIDHELMMKAKDMSLFISEYKDKLRKLSKYGLNGKIKTPQEAVDYLREEFLELLISLNLIES